MNEHLISQYIDDELDLTEKITFVQQVHGQQPFYEEAVALLEQEALLQINLITPVPLPACPPAARATPAKTLGQIASWWIRPLAGFAAALALVALFIGLRPEAPGPVFSAERRFVVYLPESTQAQLIGTFTGWKPVAMQPVGASGYWALTLPVPAGEHRYSYLVENGRQIADPTIAVKEQDDFGGENSVIEVRMAI